MLVVFGICVLSTPLSSHCMYGVYGLLRQTTIYRNLPYPEVFKHEEQNKEGEVTKNGTFCVSTGQFTGRSPKDKYFVKQVNPVQTFLASDQLGLGMYIELSRSPALNA